MLCQALCIWLVSKRTHGRSLVVSSCDFSPMSLAVLTSHSDNDKTPAKAGGNYDESDKNDESEDSDSNTDIDSALISK